VLPHNFNELMDASIACLQGKEFQLFPDFPGGGMADCSRYNDGLRGGAVRVRARIARLDKKTLVINDIPFGRTTGSVIDSILKANEKGKIKIRKIDDNTADKVEVLVHLAPGISPDKTIDALYAFTDCEVSVSPNSCVIENNKPRFLGVSEMLRISTGNTLDLLRQELEIRLGELADDWHLSSLEKIFIENRLYLSIEKCETWESVLQTIDRELEPFKALLQRPVTREDIISLTEIKIKRISRYDAFRADEHIKSVEKEMDEVRNHLANLVPYAINYFRQIKRKYGQGRERKTELRNFDTIEATKVAVANEKLYVNRAEGFAGTGLRKDEYVCDCSDIDDIIVFRQDGTYMVTRVAEKLFVGKGIIHIAVFGKNDKRTIYNMVYRDGKSGNIMMKRAAVSSVTREREYDMTRGTKNSRILYFSANSNGEAEVVKVFLKPRPRIKNLVFELDFGTLAIKGKNSMGNILTKHPVHKIVLKEKGASTLGGARIWFDEDINRLNGDKRGKYLGEFNIDDRILVVTCSGKFRLSGFDISGHFEDDILRIEKYRCNKVFSAVYIDGETGFHYVKRFMFENASNLTGFIGDHPGSRLVRLSEVDYPRLELKFGGKNKGRTSEIIEVADFIGVKSFKARGKRLTMYEVSLISELEPLIKPVDENDKILSDEPFELDESGMGQMKLEL
jgi:topoisomerase IV subunit A